ncbi:MAG: PKD domain-containing protein, partial [Blastocatellia bacterium]
MRDKTNYARHLAILVMGFAALMGWINPSGKDAYAQYYCTLSCSATGPSTGTVGSSLNFSATAIPYYCEGTPSYKWEFGDATNSTSPSAAHIYAVAGTYSWSVTVTVDDANETRNGAISITAAINTVKGVSAASYDGSALTSDAIVATFGSNLATATEVAATIPLPTALAGTTVKVKDSAGTERLAPLFFVSPGQINHQIPPGTAIGAATVTVTSGNGTISTGTAQIAIVAPGLFSANSSGQGVPSGYVLRFKADNSQSVEPINQYDAAQGKYVAVPIDLGAPTD